MKASLISDFPGHGAAIYKIQALGSKLFSCSSDKMLASWDVVKREPAPFSVKAESGLYTFHISSERLFLGGTSGHLNIIDLELKKEIKNLKLHMKGVYSILPLKAKDLIVTGGGDGMVHFLEYSSLELIRSIKLGEFKVRDIHYFDDLNSVMLACGDGRIREIELEYYNEVHALNASEESINTLAHFKRKNLLVSAGKDGFISFWRLDNREKVVSFPAHYMAIYDVKFNNSETYFVTCSRDKSIKVWDANTLEVIDKIERRTHKGHSHSVNSVEWLDDHTFISAGDDKIIKEWKLS
ncbi:MAG: WD40 repeat domain-containing protein [Flavobacteriales bacterium]